MALEKLNTVEVSGKPLDNYVLAAIVLFNQGADRIYIRGRGNWIAKAVDVANAVLRRLGEVIDVENIEIGTERRGRRTASFIKITLKRTL